MSPAKRYFIPSSIFLRKRKSLLRRNRARRRVTAHTYIILDVPNLTFILTIYN